jgi:Bacterial mobilisation protein (MobC)
MWSVVASEFIKVPVSLDVKRRVVDAAKREYLSESVWLRRLILRQLAATGDAGAEPESRMTVEASGRCSNRVHIRLRSEDCLLLGARAAARGMRPATYVSVLTRSHLRSLAPLPKDELLALRRSISELAALGRNINQIAKVANEVGQLPGSVRAEFGAMLKICEALRDSTKALLMANVASWESGHTQAT